MTVLEIPRRPGRCQQLGAEFLRAKLGNPLPGMELALSVPPRWATIRRQIARPAMSAVKQYVLNRTSARTRAPAVSSAPWNRNATYATLDTSVPASHGPISGDQPPLRNQPRRRGRHGKPRILHRPAAGDARPRDQRSDPRIELRASHRRGLALEEQLGAVDLGEALFGPPRQLEQGRDLSGIGRGEVSLLEHRVGDRAIEVVAAQR